MPRIQPHCLTRLTLGIVISCRSALGIINSGKKTMYAWYWKVCGAEYDAAHPRS